MTSKMRYLIGRYLQKRLSCAYCGNLLSKVWLWQDFEQHEACPCKPITNMTYAENPFKDTTITWRDFENDKPGKQETVLVAFTDKSKKDVVTVAIYIPPKLILAEDFMDGDSEEFSDYDEEKDCYWAVSGFYEWNHNAEVSYFLNEEIRYWAKLPKLPVSLKEDIRWYQRQ